MANCRFLLVVMLVGLGSSVARAELVPEDPYADPATPAEAKPAAIRPAETIDWQAWWEDYGAITIGGAALVLAVLIVRWRRGVRRRRLLEHRKTQFQLCVVDPTLVEQHRAAWEATPPPPRRPRHAAASDQPPFAPAPASAYPMVPPAAARPAAYVMMVPPRGAAPIASPMMMMPAAPAGPRTQVVMVPPVSARPAQVATKRGQPYPYTFHESALSRRTRPGHAACAPDWDAAETVGAIDEADVLEELPADDGDFVIEFVRDEDDRPTLFARGSQNEALEQERATLKRR